MMRFGSFPSDGEVGGGSGGGMICVPIHTDASANLTLTNQANAEQDLANSNRNRRTLDLDGFTRYRLVGRLLTASASVNTPRIYAQYSTNDSTWAALGVSAGLLVMTPVGIKDTGWIDLATGAKATSVHVRIAQNGGDGAADPAWGYLVLYFK